MKLFNTLFLSAALLTVICASSCTEEYTCQCTISYTGVPGMPDTLVNEYPITDTKKKAKEACEAKSANFDKDNVKTVETCVLF